MKAFTIVSLAAALVAAAPGLDKRTENIKIDHFEIEKTVNSNYPIINMVSFALAGHDNQPVSCAAFTPDYKDQSNANGVYKCSNDKWSFSIYPGKTPNSIKLNLFQIVPDHTTRNALGEIALICTPIPVGQNKFRCGQADQTVFVMA
ncbi:hypothetical protein E4U54_004233 [Claviceps lovelessii]|nr:hypothetical protein E4U54_004233 [Claviceps lovelessii]